VALNSSEECIHPYRLAYEVNRYLGGDGIIVADGGEMAIWMELAVTPKRPGSYLFHGYLGCLGTGIPFGLAAKAAFPDRRVLVITGDGSVGLNFAEFDTAVRHNLPIVVVIGNDQAWGMCRHEQMVRYGAERIVATELGPTHYEKAAAGFGVHAEFVERAAEIVPALERAFASGRPACVNVMTDPGVISPMVLATTSPAARPRPVPQEAG
jgi:acetolactate synthase-1/2/3 large subunit